MLHRFAYLELEATLPRARPQAWFETHIAGTMYRSGLEDRLESLAPALPLRLVREPANPYDPLAIRVETPDGLWLGYLPRRLNREPAAWLDGGGELTAELQRVCWRQSWLYLEMRVLRWR